MFSKVLNTYGAVTLLCDLGGWRTWALGYPSAGLSAFPEMSLSEEGMSVDGKKWALEPE